MFKRKEVERMNKIEIENRWTGSILFEYEKENNTLKDTVEQAVKEGANLKRANLGGAYLGGANLGRAYLGRANLEGAYLGGAYLGGANLGRANLEGAYLGGAYLGGANLKGAYLGGANLKGAYIYVDDKNIDTENIIKEFEEKNNVKITEYYINRNIIPTRWNCSWKYGLIICDWEIKEKEETTEENKEIEELKLHKEFTREPFEAVGHLEYKVNGKEMHNKINELVRAVNKLNKEREEK